MTAEALLAHLGLAGCPAAEARPDPGVILLIQFGEDAYRSSSFLDDRILGPATRGAWVRWSGSLGRSTPGSLTGPRPLHFIFHTGHVGSTLVSRLLDETGQVLSLREPLPLRTLAEAHDVLHAPESLLGPQQFERLLETLLRLWRRGYAATRAVVIKATSSAARLAPVLLERSAESRAIYLNLRAEPALATLLAGRIAHRPARTWGRAAEAAIGTHRRGIAPLYTLSPGELAAMSWLAESMTRHECSTVSQTVSSPSISMIPGRRCGIHAADPRSLRPAGRRGATGAARSVTRARALFEGTGARLRARHPERGSWPMRGASIATRSTGACDGWNGWRDPSAPWRGCSTRTPAFTQREA